MNSRVRNLIGVILAVFLLGIALFIFGMWRAGGDRVSTGHRVEALATCFMEAQKIQSVEEAFNKGELHFGGEGEYSLFCASVGYDRALAIDPRGHTLAWHQSGRIDFIRGDFDNAIFKFNKQIEFFGNTLPNVHYMLGLTYGYKARLTGEVQDWAKAEESFRRYIELDSQSPWARTDLAWVYFAQGKYEEMKPVLEEGLLTSPEHPWLLNMYGLALLNTEDREGARIYFDGALRFANELRVEEWGKAYPGNNPHTWPQGLGEMIASIEGNLQLTLESR